MVKICIRKVMHYIWCQFWLRSIRKRAKQCWHDSYLQEGYGYLFCKSSDFFHLMEATCKLSWASKNIFSLSFVIITFLEAFCINGYLCCISIYLIKKIWKGNDEGNCENVFTMHHNLELLKSKLVWR